METIPVFVLLAAYWLRERPSRRALGSTGVLVALSLIICFPATRFAHEEEQWNVFPNIDHHLERTWDFHDWLPLYYQHFRFFARFEEVPARVFADSIYLAAENSAAYGYRVIAHAGKKKQRVLSIPSILLKPGAYTLRISGENRGEESRLLLRTELVNQQILEPVLNVAAKSPFLLEFPCRVSQASWAMSEVSVIGQGDLVFDSIQLVKAPAGK